MAIVILFKHHQKDIIINSHVVCRRYTSETSQRLRRYSRVPPTHVVIITNSLINFGPSGVDNGSASCEM